MTQAWLGARAKPSPVHLCPPGPGTVPSPQPLRAQKPSLSTPSPALLHIKTRDGFVAKYLLLPSPWWTTGGYKGWSW